MSDVIKVATREAYGAALVELKKVNDSVLVLDADLSAATKTGTFKKAYPESFYNCGISECNMMGIAAGLSTIGYTVFASTFAMFAAGRAFEQIRNTIGYPHLNVKIGATHAGISVGEDGASHQCCEDIALMRTIPGMTIINPADDVEAKAAVFAAAEIEGPVYLRFGRLPVPRIFDENYKFEIGKGVLLREGTDVTIIATGLMVERALKVAELLSASGISAAVINMPTIKPLDKDIVIEAAKKTGAIVTAEEHSIIGGLGGAVAEAVSESVPVPVLRVGVEDVYGRSGPALELLEIYGLNAENIVAKAKAAIELKKIDNRRQYGWRQI
ncbi:MAG TPA: transketolase family protein [Clostridiales bacterium]|nr:transketolase family protein [Clostridiales bacterium]